MRAGIIAVVVVALATGTWLTIQTRRNALVLDHFDVVKPNVLYRSGQLTPGQLEEVIHKCGIRTLVNFQIYGDPVETEAKIAKKHQIDFMNLPMPGDGLGREEQFREVLKALDDPNRRPVLVHCARGTCRTGACVALYRLERDGWTIEDVDEEMKRQAYQDGRIAGYVYGMVKHKPDPDIYDPRIRVDHNLPPPPPPAQAAEEVNVDKLPILPPIRTYKKPAVPDSGPAADPQAKTATEVPHAN
jgi:protein tyrosine phosphatase (PTP) superfamily phosphohydrolase (DUF442 family)